MITPPYKALAVKASDLKAHFHPEHWADLQKSGLLADTIMAASLFSSPPDLISQMVGFNTAGIRSALCFPYPGTNEFCRLKVFPPLTDRDGHAVRYLQRKNSGVHLYFPPNFQSRVTNAEKIYLTEGEKKTLRADQEGVCAVGLGGIFGWKEKDKVGLIGDFDLIPLRGRRICIVPDGDFRTNGMVWRGVEQLSLELVKRGADVKLIDLNLAMAS